MTALPVADGSVDLCLNYGGLHCVADPDAALAEMTRCLRPGARLLGSTFLADGSRRQRRLLQEPGFGPTGSSEDLRRLLRACGLQEVTVDRDDGLALFSARRATS